jgi:3-oxoadipate enol-lactonase
VADNSSGAPAPRPALIIEGTPRLAVTVSGAGPLVIFLHGIGGNRSNWYRQLDALEGQFLAVTCDGRGYGESDDYEGPVTITDFAHDLLRVIEFFDADTAHVVGLSLGGRIAQRFAMLYPERLASLTLVDTRPDSRDTRSAEDREAFLAARAKPLLAGKSPADIAPAVAAGLAGPDISQAALSELIASISVLRSESYLKTIKANLDDDYVGDLSAITAPTLVMVGEFDTLTPLPLAQELANTIPNASLQVVANAGHLSNIENPESFNRYLLDFLMRL